MTGLIRIQWSKLLQVSIPPSGLSRQRRYECAVQCQTSISQVFTLSPSSNAIWMRVKCSCRYAQMRYKVMSFQCNDNYIYVKWYNSNAPVLFWRLSQNVQPFIQFKKWLSKVALTIGNKCSQKQILTNHKKAEISSALGSQLGNSKTYTISLSTRKR